MDKGRHADLTPPPTGPLDPVSGWLLWMFGVILVGGALAGVLHLAHLDRSCERVYAMVPEGPHGQGGGEVSYEVCR